MNATSSTDSAASATAAAPSSWEDLVTTALLGTDRRPATYGGSGREAPLALLDEVAMATVRRRAGLRPARAARRPEPAPEDPRPALPAAATRRTSPRRSRPATASRTSGRTRKRRPRSSTALT
ncbi:DUF5691 domain-containing protein, partial [Streptomyces sp. NPDC001155]